MDVNRYAILIAIKENWILELDKNFMDLFGFEKNIFEEGYHRSTKTPNLDKTKFLKIYCNLVDNKEDNEFITNVFIKNNISDQIIYENHNNYKRKKYEIHHLIILKFVLKMKIMKMYTVLIEIIVFPSLHLNKNASLLMIRNDVFTGTVSASTPLSTYI